ncbi:ferredoxin [Candidatus Pacearchaeota archaeon]|jgi:ferredoxin|nr:ferredoxin [Candidatus Pacearchaeota archaeon]|tara:strand:+ start:12524 stop:12697 length:174 start_codon:yes stop_codon:yes gene_type:complete
MSIKIDKEKCIGCGLCSSVCEEVFEMKDDMKANVKSQKNLPCVKDAIDQCPVDAISQ